MHPSASAAVELGFFAIALSLAGLVVVAVRAVRPQATVGATVFVLAWLAGTALLAISGLLARFDLRPPPLALTFVIAFAPAIVLSRSTLGAELATLPLHALVLFQCFRLPLELVMHAAAREGTMPTVMSYAGANFDIVAGTLALLLGIALWAGAPRWLAWLFFVIGSALLANIIVIAFLATPMVHRFGSHELNTFVAYAPFVWLPTVMVACALAGHVVLYRALRRS